MTLYFDTSAIVSLFLDEPRGAAVATIIASEKNSVLTSDLLVGEFSAAVSTAVRMQRLSSNDADRLYDIFDKWIASATTLLPIDRSTLQTATRWVRRPDLTLLFPDAVHIALSQVAAARLITGDKQQAAAASILGLALTLLD